MIYAREESGTYCFFILTNQHMNVYKTHKNIYNFRFFEQLLINGLFN